VPVLILIAVVVVLAGVYFAATGRGGELAYERVDHAPLDLGPVSAPDIAMLRPPTAMWGYNIAVTDEALELVARAMRDRDVTIAYLQEQLANRVSAAPDPAQNPRVARAPGILVAPLPHPATQPSVTLPSPEAVQPAPVIEPAQTLPGPYDVQGPQGAYDTHDWWAEQEEAAREEEARRQAAAQQAAQTPPDEADPPEAAALEASAPQASAPEAGAPQARAPEAGPPDDDPIAGSEEQAW
jgi:hypothetical protein